MAYVSVKIPDAFSVNGIYTLFELDLLRSTPVRKPDVHDFPEIIYMKRGSHTIVIDGKENELCGGQIIVYAPGSVHKGKTSTDCSIAIVSFDIDCDVLDSIYNRPITLGAGQRELLSEIFSEGCKCFTSRSEKNGQSGMVLTDKADERTLHGIRKRLELFLIDLLKFEEGSERKKSASSNSDFDAVIKFLRSRVYSSLTVSEIADGCGMSVSKLKYLSRENSGGGVINCFIEMKIDEAKRLIREGKCNFTEIADRLSFDSLHYFSRVFRKTVGISPSEYAKSFAESL